MRPPLYNAETYIEVKYHKRIFWPSKPGPLSGSTVVKRDGIDIGHGSKGWIHVIVMSRASNNKTARFEYRTSTQLIVEHVLTLIECGNQVRRGMGVAKIDDEGGPEWHGSKLNGFSG